MRTRIWKVLGLKFALLYGITCLALRGRVVKAVLPDNVKILLRSATDDIWILDEIYLENIYEKHHFPSLGMLFSMSVAI